MRSRQLSTEYFVDGVALLSPDQKVEISENDLDASDSGRDESGIMHRVVVREGVRTWSFAYAVLTADDYLYIKNLFKGKSEKFTFKVTLPDGTTEEVPAYCSKRSITLFSSATGLYKNLKFNIIEC